MNTTKINKIVSYLRKHQVDLDYCSPNYIADTAYDIGIKLTSAEIVYISDNIEKLLK